MSRISNALADPRLRMTLELLAVGGIGGTLAAFLPVPMPYLMGSLMAAALWCGLRGGAIPEGYVFPSKLRMGFIAIIGSLIGARVDPVFLAQAPQMWISLLAVTVFVLLAHVWNYQMFRRVAGFDPATSFYCGTPGGLIESIEMGDAAGADVRLLTLQHYWRVILVILIVPTGLSILHGAPLGSAGGMRLSSDSVSDLSGLPMLLAVAALGLLAARVLHLPAGPLLGALLVSGIASATGLVDLHSPDWVVSLSQAIIGVSLGARFVGITWRMIRRSIGFALLSILGMLAIGAALAVVSAPLVGEEFEVLFISMAPGGAIEMGLVALSLAVNPAFVTFHHLYRIGLAVFDIMVVGRMLGFGPRAAAVSAGK